MSCNELRDVRPDGEHQLALPSREQHGYRIVNVKLLFEGVCPSCQEQRLEAKIIRGDG